MSDTEKLTVKIQGDIKSYVASLKAAEKETDAFASKISKVQSDAGKGVDFKARADTSELDRAGGVVTALRQDAANGATFTLKADASGTQGVATQIQSLRSDAQNGGVFKIVADMSGVEGAATKINVIRSDAENGATFVVRSDVSGLSGAASEIQGVRSEADNGATFRIQGDTSGLAGAATEIQAIRTDASNDATLHVNADTSGLDAAGSSIDGLAGKVRDLSTVVGLVSVPGLVAAIGSIPAVALDAAAAVGGLVSILGSGLVGAAAAGGGALGGLGAGFGLIATPIAMVIGKLTEYDKNLQAASSSQGSAVSSANALENAEAGLEAAYSASDAASSQLSDAIDTHTKAQEDLNRAIEDEPTRQAENWLDVEDAQLSVAESTRAAEKAQIKYNEALASGDQGKITDAGLALERANLRVEQSEIKAGNAAETYYDQAAGGSTELQSAQQKEQQAAKGVESAQRGVENAARGVESAQRALAQAAEQMAASQSKAAGKTVELTAAQQALYDKFKQTQGIFNTAFGPAMDSVSLLGVEILKLADEFIPELGVASDAAVGGLSRGFDTFRSELLQPIPRTAIQDVLESVPGMVETATVGAGELGIAFITAFSRTLPYGQQLIDYLGGVIDKVHEFTQSADGISTIDSVLASTVGTGQRLWGVVSNLGVGFYNLITAINQTGLPEQMLGGLETMAQGFRDTTMAGTETRTEINQFLTDAGPVIDATGSLLSTLKTEFLATAVAVQSAINPDTGNSTLVDLVGSLQQAISIVGPWLSSTFIELGPAIAAALPPLTEFFTTFIGSSDFLATVVRDLGSFAEIFNGLPQPVKDAAVEVAAFSAATQLIGGPSLGGIVSGLSGMATNLLILRAIGGAGLFSTIAGGLLSIVGPLTAIAAVGAIAIDITYHWPEIKDSFSQAWTDANAGGSSVGAAFMAGLSAGIDETTIGSTLFSIADSINATIDKVATGPSLWEIITGDATLQDADSGIPLLLKKIEDAGTATGEWLKSWVPETTLWKVLTGDTGGEGEDSSSAASGILSKLQGAWTSVTEWVSNLQPLEFLDKVLGGTGEGDNPILTTVSGWWDGVTSWWEGLDFGAMLDTFVSGFSTGFETVTTSVSDFFSSLYNDYWLYYLGSDGVIPTAVSDFFTYLTDTYWTPYFGSDGTLITGVSDFFTYLVDTYWTPYFGTDGTLLTGISDFFTYLIDTYWTPYLGTDGTIITGVSTFFTYLVDTYWTPYFGSDGILLTAISDFFTYLIDTYWTPYFGTDGTIVTMASEALSSLETTAQTTWDTMTSGVGSFVTGFAQTLADGLLSGINTGIGYLQGLLDAIDSVLTAIGVSPLGVTLPTLVQGDSGVTLAADGLATDQMARGGVGTPGQQARHIVWNEAAGTEYWIATGGPRRANEGYLSRAAQDFGYGLVPMASGGFVGGAAGGGPVSYMAIGGGTDLGPGGLTGEAADIAQKVMDQFGVWANTYTGDPSAGGEHGSLHGNTHENTFDFWADSAFDPLDVATGDAIMSFLFDQYGNDLDTVLWQGQGTGPNGAFYDDNHYDHLHASVGGSGLSNTAGVIANQLFSLAKKIWDGAISALGVLDMGSGALWDGVEGYIKEIPSKIWSWILSKIPRGWGGGIGGLTGDIASMLQQGINAAGWSAEDLAALTELWNNESGFDPNAVNPDSGAYGIPQINPASWGTPAPLGDAASQIEWGIDYIKDRYGDAQAALDFWLANNWYAKGGVISSPSSSQNITQSGGNVHISQTSNTGKKIGPGRYHVGGHQTFSSSQGSNIAQNVANAAAMGAKGAGANRHEQAGASSGALSGFGSSGTGGGSSGGRRSTFSGSNRGTSTFSQTFTGPGHYANVQLTSNQRNQVGRFHKGGLVPGTGESFGLLQGGERVLPRDMSRGFESLARSVALWRASGGVDGGVGADGAGSIKGKLEEIREAIERSITTPTPVNLNNVDELRVAQVTAALATLDSDVGADILDRALAEAISHRRTMQGTVT